MVAMTASPRPDYTIEPLDSSPTALRARFDTIDGIQFGCSRFFRPRWLNIDIASFTSKDGRMQTRIGGLYRIDGQILFHQLDATRPLPYAGVHIDCAYAEHFIEHIEPHQAIAWLGEVHRLLGPAGCLRLTTPDLARYVAGYADGNCDFYIRHHQQLTRHRKYCDAPMRKAWMLNQIFYHWGHRWIYDRDEISHAAITAGFNATAIRQCEFRCGRYPVMAQFDLESRRDETLYIELDR